MKNTNEFVILGDPEVGKTSIINMLRGIAFSFHYHATLAFDSNEFKITTSNEKEILVEALEFSGHEIYADIRDSFEWNSIGAIIVIDATKQETLYNISTWVNLVKNKGIKGKNIIICLNKIDMVDLVTITLKDLHNAVVSEEIIPNLIISSAYTNVGYYKIINKIIEVINETS